MGSTHVLVRALADAFEAFDIPVKAVQRLAATVLVVTALFFPTLFSEALTAYADAQAHRWQQTILKPMLDHLEDTLVAPTTVPAGH